MGTRSRIGYELPDHSVISVYCHWDGHVEHNGRILVEHYQDLDAVTKLIIGGDISALRTRSTWNPGKMLKDEDGNFILDDEGLIMHENDRDPQPLYYTERGEKTSINHTSFDDFCNDMCGEEYAYLYDLNGNWKAWKIGWGKEPTIRVDIPGYVTAA
jgi:hypothetical protein